MAQVERVNFRGKYYLVIRSDRGYLLARQRVSKNFRTLEQASHRYKKYNTLTEGLYRTSKPSWNVTEHTDILKYDRQKDKWLSSPHKYSQPKGDKYNAGASRVQYIFRTQVNGKDVSGVSDNISRRDYKQGRQQAYNRFLDALSYALIGQTDDEYAQDWLDRKGWDNIEEGIKYYSPKRGKERGYYAGRTGIREDVYAFEGQETAA